MKRITILITGFTLTIMSFGQSKTAADFEKNADGYKLFLYQSVIRLLNNDKNPDFNLLIRDLDHLRFVSTDSIGVEAKNKVLELDEGLQSERGESILTFDSKDYICHVYELPTGGSGSSWIAVIYIQGRAALFEMKGALNTKYLKALTSLDMSLLMEMMNLNDVPVNTK